MLFDLVSIRTQFGKAKADLLQKKMTERFLFKNFIPYVQLHEYEALLFSKLDALSSFYTDKLNEIEQLKAEVGDQQPEEINETPHGALSKRIIKYIPGFKKQKTSAGVINAETIGLPYLRERCQHFNDWVAKLEAI